MAGNEIARWDSSPVLVQSRFLLVDATENSSLPEDLALYPTTQV